MGFVYEATKGEAVIMLFYAIVMKQHQADYVAEEEIYRMV